MPITRRRSIDALYDRVEDYDLVLTTDAPLSLALNRRLDHPHLGRFAATPRMLASGEYRPRDERDLFQSVIKETDLGWKHAAYLVEHALSAWDHTGDLEGILEYDRYDTSATREVLDVLADADSAHRDLADEVLDQELDVAVIGEEQFTALDRTILPADYEAVDPFDEGAFDLPEFHVFDSATDIVDTVLDNVTADTAADVAIVMDRESAYPALIESAFETADIPFYGGPAFADDKHLRTFLGLVRTAHADHAVRIAEVRPVLAAAGVDIDVEDDDKRLAAIDDPALDELREFFAGIENRTFGEAITQYESWTEQSLRDLRAELDRLGILDAPVTPGTVDDLEYYLQTFDVPVDRDDSGVLLADATAAAYVDRPVVFYLGMDVDWTHDIPDHPWIDADAADGRNLAQFQLLLQNGVEQYYLVQDTSAGEPVVPCLYFHDLLEEDVDRFSNLEHTEHTLLARESRRGFEYDPVSCNRRETDVLSQSDLKTFVNCPRDWFFDDLLDRMDRDDFRRGTLYHDFAEVAVSHAELVEETPREEFLDVMMAEMRPFLPDDGDPLQRTRFRYGLEVIERFLTEQPPQIREYPEYDDAHWADNVFADYFDIEVESPITERYFRNPELGGSGMIDLVHNPTRLVDYKSGSANSANQVVKHSSIESISDKPNFQPLLYLAQHRRIRPGEDLTFVFFHFTDVVDDAVTGDADLDDALVRVTYYPEPFPEYVTRREAFEAAIGDVSEGNNRRKTLEGLGYDAYRKFFTDNPVPVEKDREEVLDSAYADRFVAHAKEAVGDYKYVTRGARSTLKRLYRVRNRSYFEPDLEAFEAFLTEQLTHVNKYRESRFPVGDPNMDRVDHPDLMLTDE